MEIPTDLVQLLQYLIPGFLTAWFFYALTSYPKPSQFERIVQALIFTLFIQSLVFVTKTALLAVGTYWPLGEWNRHAALATSTGWALVLGLAFSFLANNDTLHAVLRWCHITRETSYPSEWFGAFLNTTYVVLHLKDERHLYGWPEEWPSSPIEGHFRIAQPSWLLLDGSDQSLSGFETVLVDVK